MHVDMKEMAEKRRNVENLRRKRKDEKKRIPPYSLQRLCFLFLFFIFHSPVHVYLTRWREATFNCYFPSSRYA